MLPARNSSGLGGLARGELEKRSMSRRRRWKRRKSANFDAIGEELVIGLIGIDRDNKQ